MSVETFIIVKISEAGQPSTLDCNRNPGAYRSGKRDNRRISAEQKTHLPERTYDQPSEGKTKVEKRTPDEHPSPVTGNIFDNPLVDEEGFIFPLITELTSTHPRKKHQS